MYWDVIKVKIKEYLVLEVGFIDGLEGVVKILPEHLTGVFEVLKEPRFFECVYIDDGVVTWPGELDLAPDAMYEEIKAKGEWVLS